MATKRFGDLEPGDTFLYAGRLCTVASVTRNIDHLIDAKMTNGDTLSYNPNQQVTIAVPPDDRLRKLARILVTDLMLDGARLNDGTVYGRVRNDCAEGGTPLTEGEARTVAALINRMAARADITITLPEDTDD